MAEPAEAETCENGKRAPPAEDKSTGAAATEGRGEAVVSDEVRQTLEKGMRIISDIEQTRPDGVVVKFELDLMYEVSTVMLSIGENVLSGLSVQYIVGRGQPQGSS